VGMRVGELARRTGVGVSTLRAWERRFGLIEPQRSPSGQRVYTEADVDRVNAVCRLVAEGLTLSAAVSRVSSAGSGALSTGETEAFLLHQVMQAADQAIWVSQDGRTRYANRRMAELMRCSIDDLVARPVLDFIEPSSSEMINKRTRLGRKRLNQRYEIELHRADATVFLAEVSLTPLHDASGLYQGEVAVVNDVTTRKDAEDEAKFRNALLDAIAEAVLATKPDGTILYANPATERLFGWRIDDLIGQNGLGLLPTEEAGASALQIHSRLLKKRSYAGDIELARRDGSSFPAQVTGAPVLDSDGELIGLISTLRDDSESTRLKHELRMTQQQEETAALLGAHALRSAPGDLHMVLTEVVDSARRVLQGDCSVLFEIVPGSDGFTVRAATSEVDLRVIPTGSRSLAGYTALAAKIVVVDDVRRDRRFDLTPEAIELGVVSAIAAPVFGADGITGVLLAGSRQVRRFNQSSGHFLQSLANAVGIALRPA
jgi:PAS domain S-box-containing protein